MSLDKFDTENQRELVFPILLIGEGRADVSFLMKLMTHRQITNVHFGFPTDATGGFGLPAIGKYLSSLPLRTGFKQRIKAVMIFYDNDSDHAQAFQDVKALVNAADPYTTPTASMILSAADPEKVRLMFVPIPGLGINGALENLLLQSVSADAAFACVEGFAACVGVDQWPDSHQAKMRLRSLIAAKCRGNSDMTLTNIWSVAGNPMDLGHACFDAVAQAVADVAAAV